MATQDPMTVVRTSTIPWDAVVKAARGDDVEMKPYDTTYRFSGNREFVEVKPFYARTG